MYIYVYIYISLSHEARKTARVEEAERKKLAKLKQEAITLLNMVGVPMAKFEQDVQLLRAGDKNHQMLDVMNKLCEKGLWLKKEAVHAMDTSSVCVCSKEDAKKWLTDIREQTKVLKAINSGLRKGGA